MKPHKLLALVAGVLFSAAWNPATAQSGSGRVIQGTVYDSLDARPLAGARVMLVDRSDSAAAPRSGVADSLGRFRFGAVHAGVYLLGFEDPLVDSLGISVAPRQIQLAATGDRPLTVVLAVPGPRTVHDAFCPNRGSRDSTTVLLGHLSDASTRGIVAKGVVAAQWLTVVRSGKRIDAALATDTAQSSADGAYVLCDLPAATEVAVHASAGSGASGNIHLTTPPRRGVIRREFYLTDSAASRTGSITGVVRSADGSQPIARAQVRINGDSTVATTGPDGRFSLSNVPYGTLAVDARRLGFIPQERDVDVLADAPGHVTFSMAAVTNVLDTVRTFALRDNGFEARKKAGWGRYLLPDDIERKHAFDIADVVRSVPGVTVTGLGFHAQTKMKSLFPPPMYCTPSFYLDGRRLTWITESSDLDMLVGPQDIAGVEVYGSPTDTPPQFREIGALCGSVVIWTKP